MVLQATDGVIGAEGLEGLGGGGGGEEEGEEEKPSSAIRYPFSVIRYQE